MKESAAIKAKGVKELVCVSVNDPFVVAAWGKSHGTEGKVRAQTARVRALRAQVKALRDR